jgi:tryptophan-rich sensory protein
MQKTLKLWLAIIICLATGGLGSLFTTPAIDSWYTTINHPSFNPPNWVFGPVWTLLFILMGIALFLVWREGLKKQDNKIFFIVFIIQLVINLAWSAFFFWLHNPLFAFIDLIILWLLILFLLIKAWGINKTAFWLLLPYILWVSFAGVLNYTIWQLN